MMRNEIFPPSNVVQACRCINLKILRNKIINLSVKREMLKIQAVNFCKLLSDETFILVAGFSFCHGFR